MTQFPDSDNSEEVELHQAIRRDRRMLGVGVGIFIVIIGVVGGVGWGYRNSQIINSQISNEKTVIATEKPKESQKPEVQNYTVEILNGSGVTGSAAKAAEILKSQMTNSQIEITTGNAPSQTGETISYKNRGVQESGLGQELRKMYPEATVKVMGELISDARLVLGK